MSENQYSWTDVYPKIANALVNAYVEHYRESPYRLVEKLQKMGMKFHDSPHNVDPFTIFEWLMGGQKGKDDGTPEMSPEKRIARISKIWKMLDISLEELPKDWGLDGLQEKATDWNAFVGAKLDKGKIEKLWGLAGKAVKGVEEFDVSLFAECLGFGKGTGAATLTYGLYWIRPDVFIPFDADVAAFFKIAGIDVERFVKKGGVNVKGKGKRKDFAEWYGELLTKHLPKIKEERGFASLCGLVQYAYDTRAKLTSKKQTNVLTKSADESNVRGVGKSLGNVEGAELKEPPIYLEGGELLPGSPGYKPNSAARRRCLKKFECVCVVCGFDFKKEYGELGEGFIEVHHLNAISEKRGEEYNVNPEEELRPVCPNCHRMLHRESPLIPPERLAKIMAEHRK